MFSLVTFLEFAVKSFKKLYATGTDDQKLQKNFHQAWDNTSYKMTFNNFASGVKR